MTMIAPLSGQIENILGPCSNFINQTTCKRIDGSRIIHSCKLGSHHKGQQTMFHYAITWLALRRDRRGVTAMEYGLIAALVATAIIASVTSIGTNLGTLFTSIAGQLVSKQ
jgi:pilus assembly protein Flp/PilA